MEKGDLHTLIVLLQERKWEELEEELKRNSNLPGQMANLLYAETFREAVLEADNTDEIFTRLKQWLAITPEQAPGNEPLFFLPMTAGIALSSIYQNAKEDREEVLALYRDIMVDKRWRMRESVVIGMQHIAAEYWQELLPYMEAIRQEQNDLMDRALIAMLAHPPFMEIPDMVQYALSYSKEVLQRLELRGKPATAEEKENQTVLEKGLSYAISLFVLGSPQEGFAMLRTFLGSDHKVIKRILKSNLKKNRLQKAYPKECEELLARIG